MRKLFPIRFHTVPLEHHSNFRNLYFDIGWYGVLNGSTIAFLSIYAARMGATTGQLGIISAAPAIISLFVALPAGAWLKLQSTKKAVLWSVIGFRSFYIALILLPILSDVISPSAQVQLITLLIFIMSIPGTALSISFNAFFSEAVPDQWRGLVLGIRNAIQAVTTTVTALFCGWLLNTIPFPNGYPYVFAIGLLGAVMSSVHLFLIRIKTPMRMNDKVEDKNNQTSSKTELKNRINIIVQTIKKQIRFDIFRGQFGLTLILLFFFHIAQYLPTPIFPVYSVRVLKLNDQVISMGTAFFNLAVFLGSTQFPRLIRKYRTNVLTGSGLMILAVFPILLSLAKGAPLYLFANIIGGLGWSVCAVSYTHLRAHETVLDLVCRLLLEKKKITHMDNMYSEYFI